MRVVSLALAFALALGGCLAQDPARSDKAVGGDAPPTSDVPDETPTSNETLAVSAQSYNQTGSSLANVTTPAWGKLTIELAGNAGEWVWFFQPLSSPSPGLSYTASASIQARGSGRVGAYISPPELVNTGDGADLNHSLVWSSGLNVFTSVGDTSADIFQEDTWSSGCTNCTFRAVQAVAGATAPWTAVFTIEVGEGPRLQSPDHLVRGTGTWLQEFSTQGALPVSAREPWQVDVPVDAGISVWTFVPPADPGGYGNVTAHMASENYVSDNGAGFLEGVDGVPNYSMKRWSQGKVGFPGEDTAQLIVERTGVQAELYGALLHSPGLVLPPLMRDGWSVRQS